ncbi:MAG: PAS domain S-box protein [Clostridia bacterium]|nr:PAS domain S-box protein [Clostridia bacterium]
MDWQEGIKMLRAEMGLTQKELAGRIDVSFTAVNRWENGRARPHRKALEILIHMAKENGVSGTCLDYLNKSLKAPREDGRTKRGEAKAVTEKMKLEQRELLTSEQLKRVLNSMNIGVVGVRVYEEPPLESDMFYCNQYFADMLGYTLEEIIAGYKENVFSFIHPDDWKRCKKQGEAAIKSKHPEKGFDEEFRVVCADGSVHWFQCCFISAKTYSYGIEIFATCRDITERVEAQNKYQAELAYRTALFKSCIAWVHCNLTLNAVLYEKNNVSGDKEERHYTTADAIALALQENTSAGGAEHHIPSLFDRKTLINDFTHGKTFYTETRFAAALRRWIRLDYHLIQNPVSGDIEVLICMNDTQHKKISRAILKIISTHFFDYIGCVDVKTGGFEFYFKAEKPIRRLEEPMTNYIDVYKKQIQCSVYAEDQEKAIASMELSHVQGQLQKSEFYSFVIRVIEMDDKIHYKKISFTYLDAEHQMIIIARSDIQNLEELENHRRHQLDTSGGRL